MPRPCCLRKKGDNNDSEYFYYFLVKNEIELWTSPDPKKHKSGGNVYQKFIKDYRIKSVVLSVGGALIFNLKKV